MKITRGENLPSANRTCIMCTFVIYFLLNVFTDGISKELIKGTMGKNASLQRCGFVPVFDSFPAYNSIMF